MEAHLSNKKELVISGKKVNIIEWNGKRVLTTAEMALHHDMPTARLNEKFRRNKKYFIENQDYYRVSKLDILEAFKNNRNSFCDSMLEYFNNPNMTELFLFTESGYLRFVKTINDDKAWEIYGELIETYFLMRHIGQAQKRFLGKSKENRRKLTDEWAEHGAINFGSLTVTEYKALFDSYQIRKKQMNDNQLSLLSGFEYFEELKLQNNPDIQGDNELKGSINETAGKILDIIKPKVKTIDNKQ